MSAMASQFTSLAIVYSTVYSGADQTKHHTSASLAFVRGIHRSPVNSPNKWPVTRKMFPFHDVIMYTLDGFHIQLTDLRVLFLFIQCTTLTIRSVILPFSALSYVFPRTNCNNAISQMSHTTFWSCFWSIVFMAAFPVTPRRASDMPIKCICVANWI